MLKGRASQSTRDTQAWISSSPHISVSRAQDVQESSSQAAKSWDLVRYNQGHETLVNHVAASFITIKHFSAQSLEAHRCITHYIRQPRNLTLSTRHEDYRSSHRVPFYEPTWRTT
jgi:hypothetical protein